MGLPSPCRAIWGYVAITWLIGGLFAWSLIEPDPLGALVMGVGFPALGILIPLQASLRLRRVLREFAEQVPGDPEPDRTVWNEQTLTWDRLDLTVEGSTFRGIRLTNLVILADGSRTFRSPIRAREAAREALETLDREPDPSTWGERLPDLVATGRTVAAAIHADAERTALPAKPDFTATQRLAFGGIATTFVPVGIAFVLIGEDALTLLLGVFGVVAGIVCDIMPFGVPDRSGLAEARVYERLQAIPQRHNYVSSTRASTRRSRECDGWRRRRLC
jgi:hypothetical protein